jgi:Ca-activated chloride channel homolog
MFRFENEKYLWLLLIIPVLILIFWLSMRYRKNAVKRLGQLSLLKQLMPDVSYSRPVIKFIFLACATVLMLIAIAGPQMGARLQEKKIKQRGVQIMIALDVSNSMLAQDITPSRLQNAKRAIAKLVDKMKNDRIGFILFAGNAYLQVPMTTDYNAVKMFLNTASTEVVPRQGTAIGEAIELATKSFPPAKNKETGRAIIIITDGENHEEGAISAAEQAAEKGIVIHTIGMGSVKGAPIPLRPGSGNYRKDQRGSIIVSKLNEAMLQQIAVAGNGMYVRARNNQNAIRMIYDQVNKMQKEETQASIYSDYEEGFQYFLGIALLLLFIEFFILERKNKYLKEIKLFD